MALDWRDLSTLTPAELQSALLAEVERLLSGRSGPEEDELLAQLPAPLGVLQVLDWLDFEVSQGSLLAYFYNSHGRHAVWAAAALDEIGARRMASVLRQAIASMAGAEDEWAARRATLDDLAENAVVRPYAGLSNVDRLSTLTDEFRSAADEDGWGDKLDAFLARAVADQVAR